MKERLFKKSIILSLLGHLTLFGMFSFSFGPSIGKAQYPDAFFFGGILSREQFSQRIAPAVSARSSVPFVRKPDTGFLDKLNNGGKITSAVYVKPAAYLNSDRQKPGLIITRDLLIPHPVKNEPAIMFYPELPYNFQLYFKDRQVAHVELMFKGPGKEGEGFFSVKRKVSSGNLEVDLLSMRYISRYLFIQRSSLSAPYWRTVRIDLSAKND